mgnify:CR=1 FL=1
MALQDVTIAAESLLEGAKFLGINLDYSQVSSIGRFLSLLEAANTRLNLTRVPAEKAVSLHILDSLSLCYGAKLGCGEKLIDIGSGAGFPGIPLAIAFPNISVTLLDCAAKRINFLKRVVNELRLSNVTLLHARAEHAARNEQLREYYDYGAARALARLRTMAELTLPFIRVGGAVVALKSADIKKELAEAANAVKLLGGTIKEIISITLPGTAIKRELVILSKIQPTKLKYPRSSKLIKSKPL